MFEGRDAAGKGGTIKRFMEHLNPRFREALLRSASRPNANRASGTSNAGSGTCPRPGKSSCSTDRGTHVPLSTVSWATARTDQYLEFLRHVPEFERSLQASDMTVIKLWFSVSRKEQVTRFTIRRIDPVRQWKLSPSDLASLDRWNDYTVAKETMFLHTDTTEVPWTVVRSNDKKRGRVEAMRSVLARFDYPDKDHSVVGVPDPLIVGPPGLVSADAGELS